MKKLLFLLLFAVLVFLSYLLNSGYRVLDVKSPNEIFVDLNSNLIFDEETPFVLPDIKYINENTDYSRHPLLKVLSEEEKFFLNFMAKQAAIHLLKNRYVKVENNDLLIGNKSYSKEILNTKFVFDSSEKSQRVLIDNIKSINLDEYVIVNVKNKKYHKLNCKLGRKSNNYKIVKRSELNYGYKPCKHCIVPDNDNSKSFNSVFSGLNIKIFFIDLNEIFKPDNKCLTDVCRALKEEIDNAKVSIDMAVYGMNNQKEIMKSLVNAKKRGVKIRRIYDYSATKHYVDNNKLDNTIVDYKTNEKYGNFKYKSLMHNKYIIFDDKKVWTGSSNISSTDLSGFNSNYAVLINSKELTKKYKADFEQMYEGCFDKCKQPIKSDFIEISSEVKIKPLFSPQDNIINSEIIPLINSAEKSIYIPIFFITHKGVEQALINAFKRGVEVKVINDAVNAHNKYTIHKNLRKEGIKVKTENYAGKLHSKMLVIDDKYSIIGSMNLTKSANSKNDENVLIVKNIDIANYMQVTFNHLWNKIPSKYENFDPRAEALESLGSCFDGIDNDFDEKIDNMDEGCSSVNKN